MSPQGRSGVGPYPDPDVPAGPVRVEARAQSGQVLEYDGGGQRWRLEARGGKAPVQQRATDQHGSAGENG